MNTKRRALPVLLERDFRKLAASEGATVEIECVSAPNPDERFSGEWLFYVVSPAGERFLLVTALARERIVNSPIGMFGLAFGKLNLPSRRACCRWRCLHWHAEPPRRK